MNCRDSENLILAERDGVLTNEQRAGLSAHLGACPACQQLQLTLNAALDRYQADAASVQVPDADEAWRELRAEIQGGAKSKRKRPLAPIVWLATPLAAAAAIALAFIATRPAPVGAPETVPVVATAARSTPPPPIYDPSIIAGADFVEAGDPNASTMVYVDKESGWLVVWATDATVPKTSG
jgi:anti-sigma factor RsiW